MSGKIVKFLSPLLLLFLPTSCEWLKNHPPQSDIIFRDLENAGETILQPELKNASRPKTTTIPRK
jgi:hypothetical protein